MSTPDLFAPTERAFEPIADGAAVLRRFAADGAMALLADIDAVANEASFRHMETLGGHRMSAAMTNCGTAGWTTDRRGYCYERVDPETGADWPPLPKGFAALAAQAAEAAGFSNFQPDACLINRYAPGAKLSLHQDRDEVDFSAPIVSVSLGLPATFLFGGARRTDRPQRIPLQHGDVVVWGGPARLYHHGVAPLKDGRHPLTGGYRYNLTLRKAL